MANGPEAEPEIKVEKKAKETGIKVTPTPGELPPPLKEGEEVETPLEEEIAAKKVMGKIPLSPAVVKPPLRFEGLALAEATGYPGWIWTEEDLEDFAMLIQECGIQADPRIQVLIGLFTLHGAKMMGYMAWKKAGRPGDLKKLEETGETKRKERPGEKIEA